MIVVAAAADQGDEEDADEDDGAGVPGVGTSVGLPGTVAGAGVVGTFVGAGDGLRVSVVAVTDDTERPGTPSASPAAVAKAGGERSDDRSLAYASEEAKLDDDSEADTAKGVPRKRRCFSLVPQTTRREFRRDLVTAHFPRRSNFRLIHDRCLER